MPGLYSGPQVWAVDTARSLTQELFRREMDNSDYPRNSLGPLDSNIGAQSRPTARPGSPFNEWNSLTIRRKSSGLGNQYLKPAIDAMTMAIGFRVRQGRSEFTISADSVELDDTILGHLRATATYEKIRLAIKGHMEQLGLVVQIEYAKDLESGLILQYICTVRHASGVTSDTGARVMKEYSPDLTQQQEKAIID